MRGLIISILLGILAGVWSIGVMPFFFVHDGAGLIIPGLILLFMSTRLSRGVAFALSAGMVLDSYGIATFEGHTIRLFLLALVASIIFSRWLTNRSIYTAMALALLLTVLDQLLGFFFSIFGSTSSVSSWSWVGLGLTICFHVFATALGFTWVGFFTKRLWLSLNRRTSPHSYG